jgi:Asp-tRNA(Asn)/Glu-tRNA(Gln) amidotransferase A subunit family amidase
VAAGYCPLALGTQTVGYVIRPAAYCGVLGFKPTFGRITAQGIEPFSLSMDHVGMFTPDIAGMEAAASILCQDWHPAPVAGKPVLGVPDGAYLDQAEPETRAWFEALLERFEWSGYTVRSVRVLGNIAALNTRHQRLIAGEMALVHAAWLLEHADLYRPRTRDLILLGVKAVFEELDSLLALPLGIPDAQFHAAEKELKTIRAAYSAVAQSPKDVERRRPLIPEVQAARDSLLVRHSPRPARSMLALRAELEAAMGEHGIDLWVSPAATGTAPEGLHSTGSPAMNLPWTHAGMPAVTLPGGRAANGMPYGVQFAARFGDVERLLAWAAGLEPAVA